MKMMIIIVRDNDADNVVTELVGQGYRVTRMASTGGFLKRPGQPCLLYSWRVCGRKLILTHPLIEYRGKTDTYRTYADQQGITENLGVSRAAAHETPKFSDFPIYLRKHTGIELPDCNSNFTWIKFIFP